MASPNAEKYWRLASFNLESLDEQAGDPAALAARAAVLRPLLERLDADVLCLQEVNAQRRGRSAPRRFHALERLLEKTRYAGFHRAHSVHPRTDLPADVHNLVTLSRWPIATYRQLFHDLVPAWRMPPLRGAKPAARHDIHFDRPVLIVEIEAPFGPLHIFNLHLRAPRAAGGSGDWPSNGAWAEGFYLAALKRQGQALEARLAADEIFAADGAARIAVCGDLNADSYETPTRILGGTPDEGEASLKAGRLEMLDQRLPPERRFSVIHDGRKVMLDHILVSPALAHIFSDIETFNDDLADEAHVKGPIEGSLHAPLLAKFRMA